MILYNKYQSCLSLRNAPANESKVYLSEEGFDFDDIDGSFQSLRIKKFNEILLIDTPYDEKTKFYYNELLGLKLIFKYIKLRASWLSTLDEVYKTSTNVLPKLISFCRMLIT
jgi:hypothetical protein